MFKISLYIKSTVIITVLILSGCLSQDVEITRKYLDFELGNSATDEKIKQFIKNDYFKSLPPDIQTRLVEKLKELRTEDELDFYFSQIGIDSDPRTSLDNSMAAGNNILNLLEQKEEKKDTTLESDKAKVILETLPRTEESVNNRVKKVRKRGLDSNRNYIFDSDGIFNHDDGKIILIKSNPRWLDPRSYFSSTLDNKTLGGKGAKSLAENYLHISGSHQDFLSGYTTEDLYLTSKYKDFSTKTSSRLLSYFIYGIDVTIYYNSWSGLTALFGGRTDYTRHDVMPIIFAPANAALTKLRFFRTKNFDAKYFGKTVGYVYKSGILQKPDPFDINNISHGEVQIEVKARAGKEATLKGILDFTKTGIIGLKDEPFKTKIRWEGEIFIHQSWPVDKSSYDFKNNNHPYPANIDKYNKQGVVNLNFFGPIAEEVGGTFNFILDETNKYIKELSRTERVVWDIFNGSFGAKR